MTQLSKNLMCIQMRSGVEIWAEQERVEELQKILKTLKSHIFVNYDNQTVNTADIVGIFDAETMSNHTHRKNGQWQCDSSKWHDKFEKCECDSYITNLKKKYESK